MYCGFCGSSSLCGFCTLLCLLRPVGGGWFFSLCSCGFCGSFGVLVCVTFWLLVPVAFACLFYLGYAEVE